MPNAPGVRDRKRTKTVSSGNVVKLHLNAMRSSMVRIQDTKRPSSLDEWTRRRDMAEDRKKTFDSFLGYLKTACTVRPPPSPYR